MKQKGEYPLGKMDVSFQCNNLKCREEVFFFL